ncbi:MAG: inositol monophosphatase family protein [Patescibacteria group bacterium]
MINLAKRASMKAGEYLLGNFNKTHKYNQKRTLDDFSTEADKKSEEIILSTLQKKYPDHNILSEEVGKIDNNSEYTWVIDPLDGTIAYSSKLPFFGVSIGLLKKGKPILGVINLPKFNILVWAEEGKGAFNNGERINVSKKKRLIDSVLAFEWGYIDEREEKIEKVLRPLIKKTRYFECFASAVFAQAYVSMGLLDGYIHKAHPWDFAAGMVILKEAGGKITDWDGKKFELLEDRPAAIISNGLIHEEILNLMK